MFHTPDDGRLADVIPFFWQGRDHLFYLKDDRDVPGHGRGTPWFHLVTDDHATSRTLARHCRGAGRCRWVQREIRGR